MLFCAPDFRETVQEASWQTRKRPVKTRFAVVLPSPTANTAALLVKALGKRSSWIAIADMTVVVGISKS